MSFVPTSGTMISVEMVQRDVLRREDESSIPVDELQKEYHDSFQQRMELDRETLREFHRALNKGRD